MNLNNSGNPMKKKKYEGSIDQLPSFEIFLNVNHLKEGAYKLNITHNNKIIKRIQFSKK